MAFQLIKQSEIWVVILYACRTIRYVNTARQRCFHLIPDNPVENYNFQIRQGRRSVCAYTPFYAFRKQNPRVPKVVCSFLLLLFSSVYPDAD